MRDTRGFMWRLVAPLLLAAAVGGCAFGGANQAAQLPPQDQQTARTSPQATAIVPERPPINTSRNLYEGSLWRGASSWGNLLRDHRARYKGDLLSAVELQKIIKVPEIKPEQKAPLPGQPVQPGQAAAAQAGAPTAGQQATQAVNQAEAAIIDPVLAFLRAQEKRRQEIEREQNEILRSIESIELEVVRVLPNGNLLVRGVHPPIFRDGDRVKYVVTLQGIVRPSDVDENNNVQANRISKADVKIRRFVRRDTVPLGDVARAGGRPQQGELLDRLTNFMTAPSTGNRTTPVSPK